jgi:broad specificity phosphatase PhoE
VAILLVRHGETALNLARIVQPADTPLSEIGLKQVEALAERVARDFPVRALATSDMLRARQSAAPLVRRLGLVMEVEPALAERNFGVLRGRTYESLGLDLLAMREAPEGGESAAQFEARVARAWSRLVRRAALLDGDLLAITHGLVIRRLLAQHLASPLAGGAGPGEIVVGNASITVVASAAPHVVHRLACEAHLGSEAADSPRAGGPA